MARNSTRYKPLNLNPNVDREKSLPLHNAELLLQDAHAMLFLPRKKSIAAFQSGCNYAMLITLCSLLGGISRTIYPRKVSGEDSDRNCFLTLFRRMPWGSEEEGWIDSETAADLLYRGFRCPLIHELGTDEGGKKNKKPLPHAKYVVGKRGKVPADLTTMDIINRDIWENEWAVMHYKDKEHKKVKISLVGLYFQIRKLTELLSHDEKLINEGVFPIRS